MSDAPSPTAAPASPFRHWLRGELLRELRLSAVFLALGLAVVTGASFAHPAFGHAWTRLNSQLTYAALEQHPTAIFDTFATRLTTHEYGWGIFSWSEPFNVTAAREQLRADFPEFVGVGPNGQPQLLRRASRQRPDSAAVSARANAYLARHEAIESRRFNRLHQTENPFEIDSPTQRLARVSTKLLGVPDAAFHVLRTIISSGVAGILLASGTLAVAAVALWSSPRPARHWLKVLLWPFVAAALGWVCIALMSIAAAFFGGFTSNTSGLALIAGAPLIYLAAKAPLRFFQELQLKPKPWDGVDRRRAPRPPVASA
jgi:hypothetical protein